MIRNSVDLGVKCLNLTKNNKRIFIEAVPSTRVSLITMSDEIFNKLKADEVTAKCVSTVGNTSSWQFTTEDDKRYTFVCEVENPLRLTKSIVIFDYAEREFIVLPQLNILDNVMGSGRLRLNGCYGISNYSPGNTNITVGKTFSVDGSALRYLPTIKGPFKIETCALFLNGLFNIPEDNEVYFKYNNYNIRKTITRCCIFYKLGKVGDIFTDPDKYLFTIRTLDQVHPDKFGLFNNSDINGADIVDKTLYFTLG